MLLLLLAPMATVTSADNSPSTAEVMEVLGGADWRQPDPANLLYMELASGTIVMELAPAFAPNAIANIKVLTKESYFDGLAIIRSQDNYVVQWTDPAGEEEAAKSIGSARTVVAGEFDRQLDGIEIVTVDSRDAYADIVGFATGFPVASNGTRAWLAHCYGMVGVARDNAPDSGNGTSLYVITGHAPRHLDRNVALIGRVIFGIELLSVLPRGTGALGFYESPDEATPIIRIRSGSDLADEDRAAIEIMRTDTEAFSNYVLSRQHRNEEWFVEPTGRIDICNINPPVRVLD